MVNPKSKRSRRLQKPLLTVTGEFVMPNSILAWELDLLSVVFTPIKQSEASRVDPKPCSEVRS